MLINKIRKWMKHADVHVVMKHRNETKCRSVNYPVKKNCHGNVLQFDQNSTSNGVNVMLSLSIFQNLPYL